MGEEVAAAEAAVVVVVVDCGFADSGFCVLGNVSGDA